MFLLFILSNNVLDATKAFAIVLTDRQDVVGLPDSLLKFTAEAASVDAAANLEVSRYKRINFVPSCQLFVRTVYQHSLLVHQYT